MIKLPVKDAVGRKLFNDYTQIVPEKTKGARFRKGYTVREEDIPDLLAMGKEFVFVEGGREPQTPAGLLHENDAALRLAALCLNRGMRQSGISEGRIDIIAEIQGLFRIDLERFYRVNAIPDVIIAARHSLSPVRAGDKLAGMRVIPLTVNEKTVRQAEKEADGSPLFEILPYRMKTAGLVVTGGEVLSGRTKDAFTPVISERLAAFGIKITKRVVTADGAANILRGIREVRSGSPDIVVCTGGMSVDPDDNTPGAIRASGADIVTYGCPVLPGSMFLLGYYAGGAPVLGVPGGAIYRAKHAGILDIVLPRAAAGVRMTKEDFAAMGNGGLCLSCEVCRYPACPYGKSV